MERTETNNKIPFSTDCGGGWSGCGCGNVPQTTTTIDKGKGKHGWLYMFSCVHMSINKGVMFMGQINKNWNETKC